MKRGSRLRGPLVAALLGGMTALVLASCGARSGVTANGYGDSLDGSAISGCLGDLDCGPVDRCAPRSCVAGACVALPVVSCGDGDPCSESRCVPETGSCETTRLALDEDGDGHPGPRPGFRPGDPGACGDDCDDTSPLAFPGGREACDGVDNDCNGVVDDGASYLVTKASPLLLSVGATQAGLGGLAFGGGSFGATFSSKNAGWTNTFSAFDPSGNLSVPATTITHENTDAFTGPLAWTGKVYGAVWEDRRDRDFEIYFNRLDASGRKLAKDVRVTNAPDFSLRPDVIWNGAEFIVVWADRREGDTSGRIFAQRIDASGALVGDNVPLTDAAWDADNPHVARGATELGVVWNERGAVGRQLGFRPVSADLTRLGARVVFASENVSSSAIAWSRDRYVVAWDTGGASPGPTIRGAAMAPDGAVLVAARDLTTSAPFARSQALLPLGDRLLLAWSEYQGGAYAIYTKMISEALDALSAPSAVTGGASDSVSPALSIGPGGTVAVAFEDQRSGTFQVYATRLECASGR